ncbi:MAG TPA: phenylalanine--tRNA ligase subunit alpha [Burkholderiaceae bacterium]|nr:phenylalanine--tRNA ligase subunit alpha [Burkholderiaceae bacterium]
MIAASDDLIDQAREQFAQASDAAALENAKARFLGRQGALTALLKGLARLDPEQKRAEGARINQLKQRVEALLDQRRADLAQAELDRRLAAETVDVTLPGRGRGRGGIHPVIQTWQRVEAIFRSIGFDVADGPEIENDWTNFTALNNPENHPARSMQDTFYVDMNDAQGLPLVLRTHTSPMQVRYARMNTPPIKVIAPGRTYRVDSDATHSPMFHQVEGLWISDDISFADLKGVYTDFLRAFFETDDLSVRFRPSFFPFTEPSAEVDMMFTSGPNRGRWLEISGSGQVHPQVVRNFGLDPERYIGFAFGSGLERLTMLRYGVDDLRQFFEGDLRFLSQFNR